jgi:ankyrin repeat protein
MLAAYHGHAPLVELLLQHGADPHRVNDRGQSPLAGAVFKGEERVIEVRVFLISLQGHVRKEREIDLNEPAGACLRARR